MLTEHDRPHRMDDPHDGSHDGEAPVTTETPRPFPVLEEPSWLDDEEFEEMEAPRDSAFRGIWVGVAAAAVTFVLVFAIPHWLGWYDVGPGTPRAKRELTPDSVISTVTAKPSTAPGEPAAAAVADRRTFAVQIAAFKNARQAGRVAENAKRAGYAAGVLRVESSAVPWVVRIGGYSTREQAESARDALARKGFRGGFII